MPMRYSKYDREKYNAQILRDAEILDNDVKEDATDTPPQAQNNGTPDP